MLASRGVTIVDRQMTNNVSSLHWQNYLMRSCFLKFDMKYDDALNLVFSMTFGYSYP